MDFEDDRYQITDKKPGPFLWVFAILLIMFLFGTYYILFHMM